MNGKSLQLAIIISLLVILVVAFLRSNFVLRQQSQVESKLVHPLKIDQVNPLLNRSKNSVIESIGGDPFRLQKESMSNNSKVETAKLSTNEGYSQVAIDGQVLKVRGVLISANENGAIFSLESQTGLSRPQERNRDSRRQGKESKDEIWVPVGGQILGFTVMKVEPGGVWLSGVSDQELVVLKIFSNKVEEKNKVEE